MALEVPWRRADAVVAKDRRQAEMETEHVAWTKERFEREATALRGAECLYRERPLFMHARVIDTEADGRGFWFALESLPSAGFAVTPGEVFTFGLGWDYLPDTLELINCPYVSLSAYFEHQLIRDTVDFAASLAQLPGPPWTFEIMFGRYLEIGRFMDRRDRALLEALRDSRS
jgi:hypothetical protein